MQPSSNARRERNPADHYRGDHHGGHGGNEEATEAAEVALPRNTADTPRREVEAPAAAPSSEGTDRPRPAGEPRGNWAADGGEEREMGTLPVAGKVPEELSGSSSSSPTSSFPRR